MDQFRLKRAKSKPNPWYSSECIPCDRERLKQYRSTPEYKARRARQMRELNQVNHLHKLKKAIRNAIYRALTLSGEVKYVSTFVILGCDIETFRDYLESKFTEGMTWSNMGEWHIDHREPLVTAKNRIDVIRLNHHTNLQPMWALPNLRKGATVS